jgi:endo-cleaving rubber dioxygenase
MRSMKTWGVKMPAAEGDAFLHSWQVAAHMLGVKDEYIPATWADADAQAPQILDPVLAPTPEGIKLADILLDMGADADGGVLSRPMLESLTRYFLGDEIAEWLHIPRHPGQDEMLAVSWPQYVRAKEAGLLVPGSPELYWTLDEFLRQGTLYYLSDGQPQYIEIPDGNNPDYS